MTHDGPEALPDKAVMAFGRGQRKWKLPARFLVIKLDHVLLLSDYGKGTFLKPALLNICIVDIDSLQDLLIYCNRHIQKEFTIQPEHGYMCKSCWKKFS